MLVRVFLSMIAKHGFISHKDNDSARKSLSLYDTLKYNMEKISSRIYSVGVNDHDKVLFEGLWPIPYGVSYNSYLVVDEKVALIDTVECGFEEEYLANIDEVLGGRIIDGVFGQAESCIIPGLVGFEVGLSAFGDAYAWLRRTLAYPTVEILAKSEKVDPATRQALVDEVLDNILIKLGEDAAKITPRLDAPFATDWFNGRRSPEPNQLLWGSLMGLRLSSTAPELYYAVVEATALAMKTIVDHLAERDIVFDSFIGVGGISQKSPFVMQMLADAIGAPINVSECKQSCALGSAICASAPFCGANTYAAPFGPYRGFVTSHAMINSDPFTPHITSDSSMWRMSLRSLPRPSRALPFSSRKRNPRARSRPAPPSFVALPPMPTMNFLHPFRSASAMSSPVPNVVVSIGLRSSGLSSVSPLASAISITAVCPLSIMP